MTNFTKPKPAKGTRKRITAKGSPGGPFTPGAKKAAAKKAAAARRRRGTSKGR